MARSKPGPSVSPECTGTAVALPSGCLRLLNSDEFKRTDVIVSVLQTKFNDLTYAFHEGVKTLGLGVTPAKGGNSGDEITFFVLLN